MLNRANAKLGTNLTLHDLRHTCGLRLARDPNMTLVDIKTILRHKSVETTQIYTRVRLEEIIDQVLAHYSRPAPTPACNAALGYLCELRCQDPPRKAQEIARARGSRAPTSQRG